MNKFTKILSLVLVLAMLASLCGMLGGCGNEQTDPETTAAVGEDTTYTVNVKTAGGMPMDGVEIYVYTDNTLSDLKQYGETNEEGKATITLPKSDKYAFTLSGTPKGYTTEASYSFTGTVADVVLTSAPIADESLSGATLGLGDIMYDFEVTTPDGTNVKLSEMLKEKKMVLLNFWYTTCSWCVKEFPYMQEAYTMYEDKVGIIAVDPMDQDSQIAAFQSDMQLTFPMASCPAAWSQTFSVSGYPTSLIIDRYGMICLIEAGGITSLRPFTSIFETFTADDYEQKLYTSVSELVTNVKPTYEMAAPEEVAAVVGASDLSVVFRAEEGESAEFAWPFIETEKNGEKALKASNQQIDGSFAIIYADVTLKAGEALGFDYLMSSESGADIFAVIVDGEDIFTISGYNDPEKWEACYPVVADKDGTYEIALCYIKDESTCVADDTVYIKNMRIVNADDVDAPTYLPRLAASSEDGFEYTYVEIFFNESDGYYHVGDANGPLLLADLMNYTLFNEEQSIWEMTYNGQLKVGDKDYTATMEQYCNYASNNKGMVCTVNQELYDLLKVVDEVAGFDSEDDMEWLKACKYYQAYGTDGEQLEDPIKGLATFSAYTAKEGKNVATNYFYYDRIIMPRGLVAEFIPTRSGVYRITSHNDSVDGVDGWIFDKDRNELLVYEQDERLFNDEGEVSMLYYMEKGEPYYIDIAFWDPYNVGYIYYDIEYVASSYNHFRLCSPGPFTYDSDATGDAMYYIIHGGIKAVLGEDGYYYEDLGDGKKGGKIYADFTGLTSLFSNPIATVDAYNEDGTVKKDADGNVVKVKGMIDLGGFDFSKNENDDYILSILKAQGNDPEKVKEYLKNTWKDEYDANAAIYQLDDVLAGRYHGEGEDLTEEISAYLDKMITSGPQELRGCVPVDEELANILQCLLDKFTFENVEQGWLKLCYYYDYLGPEA